MEITELWPTSWPGSNIVARFNVHVSPDIKLCGLMLRRKRDGALRAYAPKQGDNLAFHLAPHISEQITIAATAAYAERANAGR